MGLATKLIAVMAELKAANKDGTNPHFKYKFVTSDQILADARAAMVKHGVAFIAEMSGYEHYTATTMTDRGEKQKRGVIVRFTFTFIDDETGETRSAQWFGESFADDDKGINKAATAALKYFLLKTFIIPTDGEPDADAGDEQKKAPTTTPSNQKPTPPPPANAPGMTTHLDTLPNGAPMPEGRHEPVKPARVNWSKWLGDMAKEGYPPATIFKVLNVKNLNDYTGTPDEARALLLQHTQNGGK